VIRVDLGLHRAGKTTGALNDAFQNGGRRLIIVSPCTEGGSPSKERLQKLDYIVDDPIYYNWNHNFEMAFKKTGFPFVRVKIFNNDPGLYRSFIELYNTDVFLDDFPSIASSTDQKKSLEAWNPYIFWRHNRVFITTHLITGDLPKKWRKTSTILNWWGPLTDRNETKMLYGFRTINIEYEKFDSLLRNNPIHHYFCIRK
jgi:hypothetical protein